MKRSPMPPRTKPLRRKARLQTRAVLARMATARRQRREYEAECEVVKGRAGGMCEAGIDCVCKGRGHHAHHVLPRSAGGQDHRSNLMWVCWACHRHIHDHPVDAYRLGLLRSRYGQRPTVRCSGSLTPPESRRCIRQGRIGCPACGRWVRLVVDPDGGPGAVLADHSREVTP